jgi:hypothetical protein
MSNENVKSVEEVLNEMDQSETLPKEELTKDSSMVKSPSLNPIEILNAINLLLQTYAMYIQTGGDEEGMMLTKEKIKKFVAYL